MELVPVGILTEYLFIWSLPIPSRTPFRNILWQNADCTDIFEPPSPEKLMLSGDT